MPSPTPLAGPRFLTLTQAAEELNVTMSQIYALVRSGDLVGIQIGGRNQWRVERVKLAEYIDRAFQRTAENLKDLPVSLPPETFVRSTPQQLRSSRSALRPVALTADPGFWRRP